VHRVYCALNETWALDFMADALYDGRGFRTFNVLDEGNREVLAFEVGTSIHSARVIRVLDDLIRLCGRPARVGVDNGAELIAEAFVDWCAAQRIAIGYIQPGKPDQNAFIKRFNRSFREEVLDAYLFDSLEQVRDITDAWLETYNTERPHDSLGQVPPLTFLPRPDPASKSIFEVST
jgi:putative transposase